MQRLFLILICCLAATIGAGAQTNSPSIYIDKQGVMRYAGSGSEASFFGVNYTVPFAHAYRALGYLGKDRKEAIDKDVYHFARLGFNAYRIHIWDVEISDKNGNLLDNDHLNLLDYLIHKLKERNIKVVITAMTTFGNGYPERNQPTDGFSYLYDKCEVHDNPEARKAQQNYIAQLVKHVNPYTGKSYMADPDVVGFEINNEPCHAGTPRQTKEYIEGMLAALRRAGNKKPVFYNVSHNMQQIEAYYSTAIQGTTYQWYPIGLVAGHTRRGNFLPYVDEFNIPFSQVKGFANKTRMVYEFDPADITYSHIYPAMVRSFRTAGFQWITQFAYDPIDMAQYNTEYQTHFLNLAYTPRKALSMKIAAEAAYTLPRNQSYGAYPANTVFAGFRVSYANDLSEMNTPEKFYYTNHTTTRPVSAASLQSVAGYGQSPVVEYAGTGAYFIDKLEDGVWRLEVMPDAIEVADPFAKPSLDKTVVSIIHGAWDMKIALPDLGDSFTASALNAGNSFSSTAQNGKISRINPGVYLLTRANHTTARTWKADTRWGVIDLGEYVAPAPHADSYAIVHTAAQVIESGKPLIIEATVAGPARPDSVFIYTDKVSFWRNDNSSYRMQHIGGYTYRAVIPANDIQRGYFRYNIIASAGGDNYTFPAGVKKNPLDWDYTAAQYWESKVVDPGSAITLFAPTNRGYDQLESYAIPEGTWMRQEFPVTAPTTEPTLAFVAPQQPAQPATYFLRKYIADEVDGRTESAGKATHLCINLADAPKTIRVGFVTNNGYTYTATISPAKGVNRIPLASLRQTATALLPHSYPAFLNKYFEPQTQIAFRTTDIERFELSFEGNQGGETRIELGSIWLE